ncbi:ECF subfamily RNA polymerase sigma factor, BldN family [Micromonospora sp. NPDC051196]|uniref:ECF subfamily RNA polymerase sigma factor, BldN family n=1 Tax=Micromonospora sp. NPDC051196 TaxID=3155281 RepID=UPI0034360DD3
MTTFGFTHRPAGLTGPAGRIPVNERGTAHAPQNATGNLAGRSESTARRVGNRPHQNEPPHRPAVPGANAKPAGGGVATPSRPTMPAQARRSGGDAPVTDLPAAETAVIPAVTSSAGTSTGYPSRPDPSDPATEVWTLVERAQAGEAEAFGLIYDRYVDTVFRFVYFRVGNRQLAEDLTSDTFLRALKRIGSFTWQGRDLGAWLVTIARNLVADHFKSGRYRLEVTTGDVLDADREDRGPEGSPEAAVVEHITNVALLTAVKRLNPEQQECIVLRFLQGFSVAETARAMGKNEGAIKALQYRAVRALARLLPDGFQP